MRQFRARLRLETCPADDPKVVQAACDRLQEALGCSEERAFDLLYGAAASQGGGLYELASIIAHAIHPLAYVEALEKYQLGE